MRCIYFKTLSKQLQVKQLVCLRNYRKRGHVRRGGEKTKEPGEDSVWESVAKTGIWNQELDSGILAPTSARCLLQVTDCFQGSALVISVSVGSADKRGHPHPCSKGHPLQGTPLQILSLFSWGAGASPKRRQLRASLKDLKGLCKYGPFLSGSQHQGQRGPRAHLLSSGIIYWLERERVMAWHHHSLVGNFLVRLKALDAPSLHCGPT